MEDQNNYGNVPEQQENVGEQNPIQNATEDKTDVNKQSAENISADKQLEQSQQPSSGFAQNPYVSQGTYYSYSPNSNNYNQQYSNQQNYYQQSGYYSSNPKPPKNNKGLKVTLLILGIVAGVIAFSFAGYWALGEVSDIFKDKFGIVSNSSETYSDSNSNDLAENIIINSKPEGAEEINVNADGSMTSAAVIAKVKPSIVGVVQYVNSNAGIPTISGEGSGIIISQDGYIATNAHVVEGASMITVVLENGEEYRATLKGSDNQSDLAVLKIDGNGFAAAELGNSDQTVLGENVIAIGNPGGLELAGSCTSGIISGLDRTLSSDSTGYAMKYIQTDAAINPGNSGGALVNMYGQVIGINSAKIVAEGYEGLGFSIPINEAIPILNDLQKYGYVKNRARIGIGFQLISEAISQYYNNTVPAGLLVTTIDEDCDIANKDVEVNDIITEIDGKKITSAGVVYSVLQNKKPGDIIELTVYRIGTRVSSSKEFKVTVILSEDTGE